MNAGIAEQAELAGARLIFCDSQFDPELALVCGRLMFEDGAHGILNFQGSEADSGRICSAYENLPTIAIDVRQAPCELSYVGADNPMAGFIAGESMGTHLEATVDCGVDTVFVLNHPATGQVGVERTEGMVAGFESICGPQSDDIIVRLAMENESQALELVARELDERPVGGRHAVFSINEFFIDGADLAAHRAGREDEFRFVMQDHTFLLEQLACDERYLASTAYFPERYGATLIPAMIDLLAGVEILTLHELVTKDNLAEFEAEVPDCADYGR